jgi:hypothetical protein
VCCLLVLDSVTSTPQWIRQPKPRGVVHKVCMCNRSCRNKHTHTDAQAHSIVKYTDPSRRLGLGVTTVLRLAKSMWLTVFSGKAFRMSVQS